MVVVVVMMMMMIIIIIIIIISSFSFFFSFFSFSFFLLCVSLFSVYMQRRLIFTRLLLFIAYNIMYTKEKTSEY
jgi:hypothetical protein